MSTSIAKVGYLLLVVTLQIQFAYQTAESLIREFQACLNFSQLGLRKSRRGLRPGNSLIKREHGKGTDNVRLAVVALVWPVRTSRSLDRYTVRIEQQTLQGRPKDLIPNVAVGGREIE